MKKNWIIILIIFLLAANAALISTLIIKSNSGNTEISSDQRPRYYQKNPGKTGGFQQHLAEELNLNEQQQEQLREFSDGFHQTRHEHFQKIGRLKKKYFTSLTSDIPETELKELADSLGKIHAEMMLLDYQHYKNIRSICTQQQAQIFDSLGNKHVSNKNYYRNRARYGRRHQNSGNQNNND